MTSQFILNTGYMQIEIVGDVSVDRGLGNVGDSVEWQEGEFGYRTEYREIEKLCPINAWKRTEYREIKKVCPINTRTRTKNHGKPKFCPI